MSDYPQADNALIERLQWIMERHYTGYQNRVDRDTLTTHVMGSTNDSNDRKVRDAIAELPIVWDDGYFLPVSRAEARAFQATMTSRMASISKRLRVLDDYLRGLGEHAEQPNLLEYR